MSYYAKFTFFRISHVKLATDRKRKRERERQREIDTERD